MLMKPVPGPLLAAFFAGCLSSSCRSSAAAPGGAAVPFPWTSIVLVSVLLSVVVLVVRSRRGVRAMRAGGEQAGGAPAHASGGRADSGAAAAASASLASLLHRLLESHGVEAQVVDDAVYLPGLDRWANLWLHDSGTGPLAIEVVGTAPNGVVVTDVCVGIGRNREAAKNDAVHAFCVGTFHVLLAALWGVLERDQVDHEVRSVGGKAWDLYLGACTRRSSDGVGLLELPPEVPDRVLACLDDLLTDTNVHVVRLYLAVSNGELTLEALLDSEPADALAQAFRDGAWQLPDVGFASLRWLLAASPRSDGPSHDVEREQCSG